MVNIDLGVRQFVCKVLDPTGWKMTPYELPDLCYPGMLSWGYEIDENCELMVAWKLTNT